MVHFRYGNAWRGMDAITREWKNMYAPPPSIFEIKMEAHQGWPGGLRLPYLVQGPPPTPRTIDTTIK